MRANDKVLPLIAEPLAVADGGGRKIVIRREVGEEEEHRQSIIEIAEGVGERRIPLFHKVVEGYSWLDIFFQTLCISVFAATKRLLEFLCERLVFSELVKDRLVEEVLDILGLFLWVSQIHWSERKMLYVVESRWRSRAFVGLLFVPWLSRVDSCSQ